MIGRLPTSLEINGAEYAIRTDFRDILTILQAFNDSFSDDPRTDKQCKAEICLKIMYEDYDSIPQADIEEAYKQSLWFIDCGNQYKKENKPPIKLMDWEQDEGLYFPAINRVAGHEVRVDKYIHWWTFMGYYMEIGECLYSNVINIRQKKSKGKKMEKWEKQFYEDNKELVDIKRKITDEEQRDIDFITNLVG